MTGRRGRRLVVPAVLAGVAVAGTLVVAVATSEPTRSQTFFRDRLVQDERTAAQIRSALRDGSAFVDRSIRFRDITGDDKDDAIVRVLSGGASGAVAVYVFSTDGAKALRAVHRAQKLHRASTAVRKRVLSYRTSIYASGDPLCCPSRIVETELRWDDRRSRFRVAERRDVTAPAEPAAP